jgi:hypothetical protein
MSREGSCNEDCHNCYYLLNIIRHKENKSIRAVARNTKIAGRNTWRKYAAWSPQVEMRMILRHILKNTLRGYGLYLPGSG